MDFVDGLPNSEGNTSLMDVVDGLMKSAHFIRLAHPYMVRTVAKMFITNVMKLHGISRSIVSDRDLIFVSTFWKEFLETFRNTTPYVDDLSSSI